MPDKREQEDVFISPAEREEQVTKAQPKGNVPALRFPEFADKWEKGYFKDVCKITTGNKNTQDKDENGLYPFYVRSQNIERINSWTFDGEAILTAGDGVGVGKVFHYSIGKIGVHQRVYILSNFKCDGKYLYQYFSSRFYNRVKRMSAKNSVDSVRMEMIADMPLYLPSVGEQHKIGKLLALLDERISTQNRIIEKYESLIQAICDTLIEAEQHKVELSFNDFGESYSGLSGKSAEDFGEGCQYITYMNVYQNQIIDTTDVGLVKINETEQQSVVRYGDILFTLSSETPNEVGMGAVYLGDTYPLYLNSFCFGVRIIDESKIFPPFLAYYISTKSFRKAVFPLAQGSTRFNLQKSDFMKKKFLFPTVEKQNKIYSVLKAYSDKLSIEKNIANLLCEQKSYLLRQLFI